MMAFPGLVVVKAWGEKSFFYNPQERLKRGVYFCTIKEKDGDNDKASALDRCGVLRLSFGISKQLFGRLFGELPRRPRKGGVIQGLYDHTALDCLMPHPVYGWMAWVGILNPSQETWARLQPLLTESYELALEKYAKRVKKT